MKKFKEILFLKNLKRVGNVAINGKYWKVLNEANDLDDLILKIQNFESKLSSEDLQKAKSKAENLFDYVINSDIEVITVCDEDYPEKLNVIGNNKPPILYIKGDVEALKKSNIAVIGTRNPSQLSQDFETDLIKQIVNSTDYAVVSGLALGCDKIAHQVTVDENKITIAVLPSGVDVIKPSKHKKLSEDIINAGGCLISEYEPKVNVNRGSYIKRDKIVAAFCDATFVVECGVKSGTMHTVNAANDYQRQIYTYLPDERAEGSYDGNEFILNEDYGAVKVENIGDFIEELKTLKFNKSQNTKQSDLFSF